MKEFEKLREEMERRRIDGFILEGELINELQIKYKKELSCSELTILDKIIYSLIHDNKHVNSSAICRESFLYKLSNLIQDPKWYGEALKIQKAMTNVSPYDVMSRS